MNILMLSDLVVRPEFIPYSYIKNLAKIIKSVSEMTDMVISTLPDEFTNAYLRVVSGFMMRVQYEHKVALKTENFPMFFSLSSSYSERIRNMKTH